MLIAQEGEEHAYLTDFGLTKHAAAAGGFTRTGQFVGTPDFSAPEQIRGEQADARADVYALGCVLFHALTGRVPFPRDSELAKMYAHLSDPAPAASPLNPAVPAALDAVIGTAMAKEPGDRYASAGDLARAAWAALQGEPAPAPAGSVATGEAAKAAAARARHAGAAHAAAVRRLHRFPRPAPRRPHPSPQPGRRPPSRSPPGPPAGRRAAASRCSSRSRVLLVAALAVAALGAAGVFGGDEDGGGRRPATPTRHGARRRPTATTAAASRRSPTRSRSATAPTASPPTASTGLRLPRPRGHAAGDRRQRRTSSPATPSRSAPTPTRSPPARARSGSSTPRATSSSACSPSPSC